MYSFCASAVPEGTLYVMLLSASKVARVVAEKLKSSISAEETAASTRPDIMSTGIKRLMSPV